MNRYPEKFWDNDLFFCLEESVGRNMTNKKSFTDIEQNSQTD